nr:N-6 DNA methylase [uncultured Blautia sp.]DAN99292.1 MAG TPA: N-6 DNA Methylase [Caudoviricetes sp.]
MELKELTSKVIELLNIESPEQIPESLMEIVLNGKIKYFDGFCDLVKDLSIDWLQKIFQFYLADRKVKMQDYTPASLARFVGKLVQAENEHSVYDLCAGSGALTIQKWNLNNELNFVCYEYDKIVIPILLFNLAVRNIDAVVVNGDALQDEVFATYLVRKGDKYSSVKETESFKPQKTDSCISNPPYNMKWKIPPFAQLQPRFNGCELPPESNANYAFILTALDNCNEKVSMILPCGILSSEVTNEKRIRQYLVEKNLIESVILCPDKMFEATSIATCLLTLNKKKETTHIAFLDMRKTCDVEQREQNGQFGGASHENRTYKKAVNVFSEVQMESAIDAIVNQKSVPEFSKSASLQMVTENDYCLVPSRYIEFQEKEFVHREYGEIIDDLNRVINEKNGLKLTMNETLAKSVGLYEIFQMFKQSEETADSMNQMLTFTGKRIEKENFISMSKKAGELKFENGSKNSISTILLSILQMWKQHIMYLNNEENRYLAELRDAILPDLMSGKIKL